MSDFHQRDCAQLDQFDIAAFEVAGDALVVDDMLTTGGHVVLLISSPLSLVLDHHSSDITDGYCTKVGKLTSEQGEGKGKYLGCGLVESGRFQFSF